MHLVWLHRFLRVDHSVDDFTRKSLPSKRRKVAIPVGDTALGVGTMGAQTAPARSLPGGAQLGLGVFVPREFEHHRLAHALSKQLCANLSTGTTLSAQAFEKLRCSAMIVYIVASREPIDDLGDEGERALGPFVRSVAALANLAFEEHGDAPASRFPAGGVCEGLAFEPRGVDRLAVVAGARRSGARA